MRLTPRGWTAVAVAGLAVVVGFAFGQPGLNAVAASLLAALGYAAVALSRGTAPTAEVTAPQAGYPGERRRVSLTVDGSGVAYLQYRLPAGLDGDAVDRLVSLPATVDLEVDLAERGVHDLGDLAVWRRDPLGLVEADETVSLDATAVVYPRIYRTPESATGSPLLEDDHAVERQAFDALREYRPGDPLRHIHWKSSAKHDDFLVTEFDADRQTRTLSIAADAAPGAADDMATAAGTVACDALRAGRDVALELPGTSVPAGSGDAHRANLLGVLARIDAGEVPTHVHADADVSIRADREGTTIDAGRQTLSLADLVAGNEADQVGEVAPA